MNNNLPQGWCECELGDVFKTSSGGTPKRTEKAYYNGNIPWLKSGELNNSIIYSAEEFITQKGVDNSSAKLFPKGSVLLALYGATVGKLGILDFASTTNQAICCIFQTEFYKQYFLFYYLVYKKDFLISQGKGGAQPNINQEIVKALTIPYPPLNEQVRIVEKIEELFADIDDGVERLKLAQAQIKQYKQSVLKQQFSRECNKKFLLKDVTHKITDGTHSTPTYIESGIPFISVKDIRDKKIFFDNCKYISKDEHDILYKRCNPEFGDILITKSGTIGRTAVISNTFEFSLFVSVALLKPNKNFISSEYLMHSLDNYIANIDVKQDVKGGVIKNLHLEDIRKISISLPSIPEQEKIVEEIEKRFSVADDLLKQVEDGLDNAKKLKQSILKKAFSGELVPQDPTDEPASELLKRIKQERESSFRKKK